MEKEKENKNIDKSPSANSFAGDLLDSYHRVSGGVTKPLHVVAPYEPSGDQGQAIEKLALGLDNGELSQILKGVTGSGKTYTMAKVIEKVNRPTLVLSHNKTLAAQLYREFKTFFPDNAVEYFVSSYDYYQPEAYVPGRDLYIEKTADINDEIDRMKLSAAFSLMERRDVIIIASVSCIYGMGSPIDIQDMSHTFKKGAIFEHKSELESMIRMQYDRNDAVLTRGSFRVRGDIIEIFPSYLENAIRITLDWDVIESLTWFEPISGKKQDSVEEFTLYPAKQFVMPHDAVLNSISRIENELADRIEFFKTQGKVLEAERIKSRVEYDVEMLKEIGYCQGIENYSRPLTGRKEGERPTVLLDYFPSDFLTFIDESHVTLPQVGAMFEGDRSRKLNLVNYGFRLPSALDNRPLKFQEFSDIIGQRIYVSATPGRSELAETDNIVEQVIRPTGLLDPLIEVRKSDGQMEDLYKEIQSTIKKGKRVLVTTLTKKMSEDLTDYLASLGLKVRYLHSGIGTLERVDILRDLRKGIFDVLIGINLLREGLDLPEVSLVAILDADKIGFLRSATALVQTIGRASRNSDGRVIMYADRESDAMKEAIGETGRRRALQLKYNEEHGITPKTIEKAIDDLIERNKKEIAEDVKGEINIRRSGYNLLSKKDRKKYIKELESEMFNYAKDLEFEKAASLRDEIEKIKNEEINF
ncbi:MAG: excinuclease ABC subunit B [Spirochaetaceae bacterium]|nr:excinuclease ABC subunit B [Spirochaetaceae bacterium]